MIFPLRFRVLPTGDLLMANDAGDFFLADEHFLERYVSDTLTGSDGAFLIQSGHAAHRHNDLSYFSFLRRVAARHAVHGSLGYILLVPTLRCNLACSYCQVSRVDEQAHGYDWSDETLAAVLKYLDSLETDRIKIEFQGGEPLVRLDLLERMYRFLESRFRAVEYVVCTNLQRLGSAEWDFLSHPNVYVSTSLDGDALTHERNRTRDPRLTAAFVENLDRAIRIFGPGKVSALPTIDYTNPPDIDAFLDSFANRGLRSIYLRPVNYQGFARKAHRHVRDGADAWNNYYFRVVERMMARNYAAREILFEEYYFKLCLERVLRAGNDSHVDLRNPAYFGQDYILIDYDGTFYPTDEARMVTRIGHVDLSIGNVRDGIDRDKLRQLNSYALNNFHEDCIHCPHQPFCGIDVVDDLSRYGRVDAQKLETWFCKRHMALFDRVFECIYSDNLVTRYSVWRWAGLPSDETELGLRLHDSALA